MGIGIMAKKVRIVWCKVRGVKEEMWVQSKITRHNRDFKHQGVELYAKHKMEIKSIKLSVVTL